VRVWRHEMGSVAAATLVVSPSAYAQQNPVLPGVRMIELDGRAVRVQTIGLQDRRPEAPVIVFEAGASNALEIWGGILPQVASMAPAVAYDRAGLGRSEWDGTNPTPRHVAERRRRVLQQIGAGRWSLPRSTSRCGSRSRSISSSIFKPTCVIDFGF
jgi:hypothetical protein